jgi:hypothetical protein
MVVAWGRNRSANTNCWNCWGAASQFNMVYRDSQLEPQCTMFGAIDQAGLATHDKIANAGVVGGGDEGLPATIVTINSVQLG